MASHIALDPKEIANRLEKMLTDYNANSRDNIVKRIAQLHLEHIHPFVDGNGRMINNYLLVSEGFVPINIKFI